MSKFDKQFMTEKPNQVQHFLEGCNEEMAKMAKEETQKTLSSVLYTASNGMKNSFARSDA